MKATATDLLVLGAARLVAREQPLVASALAGVPRPGIGFRSRTRESVRCEEKLARCSGLHGRHLWKVFELSLLLARSPSVRSN